MPKRNNVKKRNRKALKQKDLAMPSVGVDLGGTSLFATVIDDQGRVLGECKRRTEPKVGAVGVCERVAEAVDRALNQADLARSEVIGVGVGVPGPANVETGVVSRCANLGPTWDGFPLKQTLERLTKLPVTVDNDVRVGAVGEHTYGAGRGTRDMVAIFVGTGLGGGIILGGELRQGTRSSAGEVGHMVIQADGPLCSCGQHGHAEALASRSAIEREIASAIAAGAATIVPELLLESGRTQMSSGIIGRAYDAGDAVTVAAVERAQFYLGLLISACVNLLDPEAVVVGGGVLERMGDAYLEHVRQVARQHFLNQVDVDRVRLVRAELGDYSGAMGAAILARRRLVHST